MQKLDTYIVIAALVESLAGALPATSNVGDYVPAIVQARQDWKCRWISTLIQICHLFCGCYSLLRFGGLLRNSVQLGFVPLIWGWTIID